MRIFCSLILRCNSIAHTPLSVHQVENTPLTASISNGIFEHADLKSSLFLRLHPTRAFCVSGSLSNLCVPLSIEDTITWQLTSGSRLPQQTLHDKSLSLAAPPPQQCLCTMNQHLKTLSTSASEQERAMKHTIVDVFVHCIHHTRRRISHTCRRKD